MKNQPLISVVMSVYNGEKYLEESIESILNQTYENFEFIIIDDGSTDNSLKILNEYKKSDSRIIIRNNYKNRGLIYSLNKGIKISKGKYIARMDADDISLLSRFEKQIDFMEKNVDITILSTGIEIFKNKFKLFKKKIILSKNSEELKIETLFNCSLAHPTVMIRKKDLEESGLKYDLEEKGIEDFGLWLGLSKNFKFAVLSECLLRYRFLSTSVSSKNLKNIESWKRISKNMFYKKLKVTYFPEISEKEAEIHSELSGVSNYYRVSKPMIKEKEQWIEKMYLQNQMFNWFNQKLFLKKLHEVYLKNMLIYSTYGEYSKNNFFGQLKINKIKFNIEKSKILGKRFLKKILR